MFKASTGVYSMPLLCVSCYLLKDSFSNKMLNKNTTQCVNARLMQVLFGVHVRDGVHQLFKSVGSQQQLPSVTLTSQGRGTPCKT